MINSIDCENYNSYIITTNSLTGMKQSTKQYILFNNNLSPKGFEGICLQRLCSGQLNSDRAFSIVLTERNFS